MYLKYRYLQNGFKHTRTHWGYFIMTGKTPGGQQRPGAPMSVLEKLMSPVVNLQKLPSHITPESVVIISDDEMDDANDTGVQGGFIVKNEMYNDVDVEDTEDSVLETLGDGAVLENVPLNEQSMVNEAIMAGLNDGIRPSIVSRTGESNVWTDSYVPDVSPGTQSSVVASDKPTTQGSIVTPFGKRPIIVGQSKSLDAKSERKIVQWVLERHARDGYVFTDDFKTYARSLYKGEKLFAATQCWMKKFLRRNRVLKDVKFCSKFKNTYTTEEKVTAVSMAKRYGVTYAAKHSGINQKVIHHWKLSADKGLLNLDPEAQKALDAIEPQPSTVGEQLATSISDPGASATQGSKGQALHGIVPAFEDQIVKEIKELQAKEGSVSYSDISKISQSFYKETRPSFKASYGWIRSFLERRAADLAGIELENVSKILVQNEDSDSHLTDQDISSMVDQALQSIGPGGTAQGSEVPDPEPKKVVRPLVVGPSVMFDRKTEKKLVEWALEKQQQDGYVFTDDFKMFAKSLHKGPKHFSASSGWMSLFLRRHRVLKDVKWKSKYKSVYSEEEKRAAVLEAKRLGTGHVARQLGIDSALLCAWRIKMDRSAPKQQTFWKGTKLKKFGKAQPKFHPIISSVSSDSSNNEACRGVVPEFEKRIVDLIHDEHDREGSISYEEMSRLAQSVYKETRPTFKASYAWIRNFMKRNEHQMKELNIDNVKKVFMPDEENETVGDGASLDVNPCVGVERLKQVFHKRPIIVGQSRSLDTKTEKKLVQWVVEQQEKNGYVFLDQLKSFAQSLYKGEKKFAATQAWRIKFLRRNHAALKNVKFTSSFRNQYSLEEKKVIVLEAKKFGTGHVSKKTGIDHCLINQWKLKLERSGVIPADTEPAVPPIEPRRKDDVGQSSELLAKLKKVQSTVGPGLYSSRGIVPALEKKIVQLIMNKMDEEGSVSYRHVSIIARAVYKETRPNFKASYNWVKDFIKRNKKELRQVEFETSGKSSLGGDLDVEVLISEDSLGDVEAYMDDGNPLETGSDDKVQTKSSDKGEASIQGTTDPQIEIDNPEEPDYVSNDDDDDASENLTRITSKKPIIIGKARHFSRKEEKKIVEWLLQTQEEEGFVFTDDFRRYARSLYTGPPGKFGATNAWIAKFMRRNKLENKIEFLSRLVGNNPKYEDRIVELVLEQQEKEGSVSYDDIQKITTTVYKETRPNFRACYNWIKGFIKRHRTRLANVDLENVKKVYFPDDEGSDRVLVRDYDPSNMQFLDNSYQSSDVSQISANFDPMDSSYTDLDSSINSSSSQSFATSTPNQSQSGILERLSTQKRPIIIAPPKSLDTKTEKKLVQWMIEQQEQDGCVYLDLFKQYAKSIHTGPKRFAATQAWMVRFKQRNHEALKNIVIKSRFRNEYSMEEKISIVEEAKRLGCNHVGRKLGINGGVIYSWKIQLENAEKQDTGLNLSNSCEMKDTESTRGVVPEFERAIVQMVLETQRAKGSVSYEDVSMCARSVYKETRPNFKASNNWVLDFIRKNKDEFKDVVFENKKRLLTEEEKLHILSEEKKYGTDHVVKKRNISSSTLYLWRRQFRARSVPIPKYKAIVSSKIKKKYANKQVKSYTMEEKRKMVAVAEQNGITYTSLKLGISRSNLTKWIQYFRDQGEQINISYTHSSTMKKELEQKVVAWVLQQSDDIGIVLTNRVQEQAKKIFEEAFTNYSATTNWLEGFLTQNGDKFENVRFRDKGDKAVDFSDDIKLKVCRYSEKHGAAATADLTGLLPHVIYYWRRTMKLRGHDLSLDTSTSLDNTADMSPVVKKEKGMGLAEPKSLMQQKLDRIADMYDVHARKQFVQEANIHGTSAIAAKHKIPLPLMLKWMKVYVDEKDSAKTSQLQSPSASREGSQEKLKVKLPSVEKTSKSLGSRYGSLDKKKMMEESKVIGAKNVAEKYGVCLSTLYYWIKDERDSSVESLRNSQERSPSRSKVSPDHQKSGSMLLRNIKKEPGVPDTPTNLPEPSRDGGNKSGVKRMRKYSDQFKIDIAQKASKIGCRKTSAEMNVPFTNVTRWLDMYKHLIPKTAKTLGTDSAKAPALQVKIEGEERKRKFEGSYAASPSPKRNKYSEADRIQFVKLSQSLGCIEAASKAGVSIEVLYKWRSLYMSKPEMANARTTTSGGEGVADNDDDENDNDESYRQPPMPEPRSMDFHKSRMVQEDSIAHKACEIGTRDNSESPVPATGEFTNDCESMVTHETETNNDFPLETVHDMSLKIANVSGSSMADHADGHLHAIDDNVILAADQLMEMMDAEKQHNTDVAENNDDCTETVNDVSKPEEQPANDSQGDGSLDMIQIVNVTSEATI